MKICYKDHQSNKKKKKKVNIWLLNIWPKILLKIQYLEKSLLVISLLYITDIKKVLKL